MSNMKPLQLLLVLGMIAGVFAFPGRATAGEIAVQDDSSSSTSLSYTGEVQDLGSGFTTEPRGILVHVNLVGSHSYILARTFESTMSGGAVNGRLPSTFNGWIIHNPPAGENYFYFSNDDIDFMSEYTPNPENHLIIEFSISTYNEGDVIYGTTDTSAYTNNGSTGCGIFWGYGFCANLRHIFFRVDDTGIPPSCTDGIQNQDETGVDVGGVCGGGPLVPQLDVSVVDNTLRINSCSTQLQHAMGYKGYIDDSEIFTTGQFGGFPCFNGDRFIDNLANFVSGHTTPLTLRFDFYSSLSFTPPVFASFSVYYDGSEFTVINPNDPTCTLDCNSSVLFLPGLMGSRLYDKRDGGSEDQLWEPNGNSDIEDLYLNTDGTSKNAGVYTRDIIKETNSPFPASFAGQNIYKSFANMMDDLVTDDKIGEWKYYAYDWRQSVDNIVANGTEYEEGETSLVDTLQALVDSPENKNGQVTIVTHSNGGLLAKALLSKLQEDKDAGVNELIDSVDALIMIAAPEIGTASALPSMMHGYDQRILGGVLMDEVHARELGRNMPGAFGLLPSREYINRVSASPVTFMDTAIPSGVTTDMVEAFGTALSSYEEYQSFLFGGEGRDDPEPNQTNLPISLSADLFSSAEILHDSIDAWVPPASLRVIEVAGWGLETIASYEYYPKYSCTSNATGCGFILDQRPRFTSDGDGTVIVPSAQYVSHISNTEKYWVDLPEHNAELVLGRRNRQHKDILEVNQLNNLIQSVVENEEITFDTVLSSIAPVDTSNRLRLSIHSPVSIDAYDVDGNHTGKVCPEGSDFCYVEEEITNSSYMEFGEGKYLNIPEENLSKVELRGIGIGTFTYISEKVLPDGTSSTSSFIDIPVTPQMLAEVTLNSTSGQPEMKLDVSGDGVFDIVLSPSEAFDPIAYLEIMKATVASMDLPQSKIESFIEKVDKIITSIERGKIDKAGLNGEKFQYYLEKELSKIDSGKLKSHKISESDAELLLDILGRLLDNIK